MKQPEINREDDKPMSKDESSLVRKRALINLLAMPVYLLIFGFLGLALWQVAMKFVTESELKTKLLFGVVALFIILSEIVLAYFVIRFTRWALHRTSPAKRTNE
jgi:uncharacterized membrane protein